MKKRTSTFKFKKSLIEEHTDSNRLSMPATKHPSWSRTTKSLKSTPQMICRVRAGAPDAS